MNLEESNGELPHKNTSAGAVARRGPFAEGTVGLVAWLPMTPGMPGMPMTIHEQFLGALHPIHEHRPADAVSKYLGNRGR